MTGFPQTGGMRALETHPPERPPPGQVQGGAGKGRQTALHDPARFFPPADLAVAGAAAVAAQHPQRAEDRV